MADDLLLLVDNPIFKEFTHLRALKPILIGASLGGFLILSSKLQFNEI